jgi:hypothetical protein
MNQTERGFNHDFFLFSSAHYRQLAPFPSPKDGKKNAPLLPSGSLPHLPELHCHILRAGLALKLPSSSFTYPKCPYEFLAGNYTPIAGAAG